MEVPEYQELLSENIDSNSDVITLENLCERRKLLLRRKHEILTQQNFQNKRVTTPIDVNVNVIEHNYDDLDFSSDDSNADPSFVALSDISNVKPLTPENIEWFPERDIEENSKKKRRKPKGDSDNWKRNKNKRQRMLGKEYIGFQKEGNKFVQNDTKPARIMGPLCMSTRCFSGKAMFCSKLTEEVRSQIFEAYWKMSWQEKKMYISAMVDRQPTTRKTKGSNSRRSDTKIYFLKVNDKKERVCLKTFLETLGIKEWTVRYWLAEKSKTSNEDNESVPSDVLVKPSKKEQARKYLTALPKLPSHYCRQNSSKLYLEPIIQTKSQLYRLYVDYSISKNESVASRKLFEHVLFEERIGLYQPKKDACDKCCSYKAGNMSDEEYNKHIELKELARAEKNSDKEAAQKGIIHALTADLQAVKLCPVLNASALYFKTKLAVHNFSVYNLGNNDVTCYWFDETACELKATTYASFFVDYVTKLLDTDPKDVVIFTDGCTSQNRNYIVSNAMLRLAMARNVVITQKYLERGHTQMEVDSVHSVVERKLKNKEIFLPSQYSTVTKESRKVPSPYKVITPDHTFFKDYNDRDYLIYESIRPGREVGDNCVVDIRSMRYKPSGTIEYKLHYKDEFISLPRRPKKASIDSVKSLYESRQPISKTKYNHLQELKSVIPRDCHTFYDDLPYITK